VTAEVGTASADEVPSRDEEPSREEALAAQTAQPSRNSAAPAPSKASSVPQLVLQTQAVAVSAPPSAPAGASRRSLTLLGPASPTARSPSSHSLLTAEALLALPRHRTASGLVGESREGRCDSPLGREREPLHPSYSQRRGTASGARAWLPSHVLPTSAPSSAACSRASSPTPTPTPPTPARLRGSGALDVEGGAWDASPGSTGAAGALLGPLVRSGVYSRCGSATASEPGAGPGAGGPLSTVGCSAALPLSLVHASYGAGPGGGLPGEAAGGKGLGGALRASRMHGHVTAVANPAYAAAGGGGPGTEAATEPVAPPPPSRQGSLRTRLLTSAPPSGATAARGAPAEPPPGPASGDLPPVHRGPGAAHAGPPSLPLPPPLQLSSPASHLLSADGPGTPGGGGAASPAPSNAVYSGSTPPQPPAGQPARPSRGMPPRPGPPPAPPAPPSPHKAASMPPSALAAAVVAAGLPGPLHGGAGPLSGYLALQQGIDAPTLAAIQAQAQAIAQAAAVLRLNHGPGGWPGSPGGALAALPQLAASYAPALAAPEAAADGPMRHGAVWRSGAGSEARRSRDAPSSRRSSGADGSTGDAPVAAAAAGGGEGSRCASTCEAHPAALASPPAWMGQYSGSVTSVAQALAAVGVDRSLGGRPAVAGPLPLEAAGQASQASPGAGAGVASATTPQGRRGVGGAPWAALQPTAPPSGPLAAAVLQASVAAASGAGSAVGSGALPPRAAVSARTYASGAALLGTGSPAPGAVANLQASAAASLSVMQTGKSWLTGGVSVLKALAAEPHTGPQRPTRPGVPAGAVHSPAHLTGRASPQRSLRGSRVS
jgi:hypothetical protein